MRRITCLILFLSLTATQAFAQNDGGEAIVATVEGKAITIAEVDETGGRNIYDVSHELYKARVQALYTLLSDRLLGVEAADRGIPVEELRQIELNDKTRQVNDVDIDSFIAQQQGMEEVDPRVRKKVSLFLKMQASADRKKAYMKELFKKYDVHVALNAPPAPPPEEIFGSVPPALGNPGAPVTVVSFSDYQCPYCKQMSDTLHQLHERFPNDVQIVYRHFPVKDDSHELAEAALCAGDQDKFWEFHAALFETPRLNASHIGGIAADLELDRDTFDYCRTNKRHTVQVQDDIREGQRLGIQGTPTNFVNGQRVRGAARLDALIAKVQEALAEQRKDPSIASTDASPSDKGG